MCLAHITWKNCTEESKLGLLRAPIPKVCCCSWAALSAFLLLAVVHPGTSASLNDARGVAGPVVDLVVAARLISRAFQKNCFGNASIMVGIRY